MPRDAQLEKIFHPEPKLNFRQISRDIEGNVDEGARFYQHRDPEQFRDVLAQRGASEPPEAQASEGSTAFPPSSGRDQMPPPFFQRSASLIEAPVTDSAIFRKNGAFQVMQTGSDHDTVLYPHPHNVMERLRHSSRGGSSASLKRQGEDHHHHRSHHGSSSIPSSTSAGSLSGISTSMPPRKMSETLSTLPTIMDESVRLEETSDEEGNLLSSRRSAARGIKLASFTIASGDLTEEEEEQQRQQGYKKPTFFSEDPNEEEEAGLKEGRQAPMVQRQMSKQSRISSDDEGLSMNKKVSFSVSGGIPPSALQNVEGVNKGYDSTSQFEDDDDGHASGTGEGEEKKKKRRRRRRHDHEDLESRRKKGSELNPTIAALMPGMFGAEGMPNRDKESMASHRSDYVGYGLPRPRHRPQIVKRATEPILRLGKKNSTALGMIGAMTQAVHVNSMMDMMYGNERFDHSPHDLFIEMNELQGEEWVENARWIKYEEDREEGAERWGKAHISSLSFHSLINLRLVLEKGVLILDLEARDLPGVVYRVVEELSMEGILEESQKAEVLRVLLFRHKYVSQDSSARVNPFRGIRKNMSQKSLNSLMSDDDAKLRKNNTFTNAAAAANGSSGKMKHCATAVGDMNGVDSKDADHLVLNMPTEKDLKKSSSMADLYRAAQNKKESILKRIKAGTEGTIVLVGELESLTQPAVALIRLAEGIIMPNALEVPLPVRFIFIFLAPKPCPDMDPHEIGRAFCTLMSNVTFHNVCYQAEERHELLSAINGFLDDSVVLPPGDWDSKNLLSLSEITEMRQRRKRKREEEEKRKKKEDPDEQPKEDITMEKYLEDKEKERSEMAKKGPLVRTNVPFGGIINDIKRRYPFYLSDFKDGLNAQVFAAIIFIYFACLSGAVAFGGLTADKTGSAIGIPETLIVSSVAGIIFALFAGQPLIIVGSTGPVLLYDEALFGFASGFGIDFLNWRVWIGFWTFIISLVVAGFQGSTLVRYFTKFTKDIFASLVSLLFVYEALRKVVLIFNEHPLRSLDTYCNATVESTLTRMGISNNNQTSDEGLLTSAAVEESMKPINENEEPNTALLSAILMFGTFFIAYFLRVFRNGKYLGRTVRRALGDFGMPIAIVVMVLLDLSVHDTFTQKLSVPSGIQVTDPLQRGWVINPFKEGMAPWVPFSAIVPAMLLYLLLFMETHICELLMMERTNKKGCGLHLDIVLLSLINCFGGLFGGPWICAATVRAVAHVSALTVMSTTHAPGESPSIVDVKDQRLSGLIVSIMVGVSIALAPVLALVPFPVLFGVFLYMGISSINGIQFFDRVNLLFMPVKHHPQVSYVRRVKTWKMNLYTLIQFIGLAVLWVVKSSALALAFPFFVVAMIPYRLSLKFIYTERELDALDGPKAGQVVLDDQEPDFYTQAFGG